MNDVISETAIVIDIRDLRFSWRSRSDAPVLILPAFSVSKGEALFIKGPSGSGKTTLLSLLGGVITPQAGTVTVLDTVLNQLQRGARDRFRADHIGFIFQMFNLIPYLSLIDNVTLPCRFSARRRQRAGQDQQGVESEARRLLAQLGLADPGLLARPVTELSVGQQQRVAAARALIGKPEFIIADEPTSALDVDARGAFIELLFAECRAAASTLLFVSHDSSLAARFDRELALNTLNQATPVSATPVSVTPVSVTPVSVTPVS